MLRPLYFYIAHKEMPLPANKKTLTQEQKKNNPKTHAETQTEQTPKPQQSTNSIQNISTPILHSSLRKKTFVNLLVWSEFENKGEKENPKQKPKPQTMPKAKLQTNKETSTLLIWKQILGVLFSIY